MSTALDHTAAQRHTVIVLHDLDTGAMAHLEEFLDASLARGDVFTTELPSDCVPMRAGARVWKAQDFAEIVAVD